MSIKIMSFFRNLFYSPFLDVEYEEMNIDEKRTTLLSFIFGVISLTIISTGLYFGFSEYSLTGFEKLLIEFAAVMSISFFLTFMYIVLKDTTDKKTWEPYAFNGMWNSLMLAAVLEILTVVYVIYGLV